MFILFLFCFVDNLKGFEEVDFYFYVFIKYFIIDFWKVVVFIIYYIEEGWYLSYKRY